MTIEELMSPVVHLSRYLVASADMYYTEEQQRDIFLGRDRRGHVRIWAFPTEGSSSSALDLCEILLEQAMYCCTWCSRDEAHFHMDVFGDSIGRQLAHYLQANPDLLLPDDPLLRALQQVFSTIGADCTEEHIECGVQFLVSQSEFEELAHRLGLSHLELARHGMNALCRALIRDLNPGVAVESGPDTLPTFCLTVRAPALA